MWQQPCGDSRLRLSHEGEAERFGAKKLIRGSSVSNVEEVG
jgi:hypothetical protein